MSLAKAAKSMNNAMEKLQTGRSVFISYARPDRSLVEQLTNFLRSHGYVAWWDDQIKVGDYVDDRIIEALDAAIAVVVLWSDHSVRSRWVKWEANQGLKQSKLVPLAVPGLDLRDIRPPFSDLNTLRLGDETQLLRALSNRARA